MASSRKLVGGAGGTGLLGIRLARVLYGRWRVLSRKDRERLAPLAEQAKERALDLRGAADGHAAERELRAANETLAAGIVEAAEADPELTEIEVRRLREDLRRELDRLASAEIHVSRGSGDRRSA